MFLFTWTVDDPNKARKLKEMGVDGIVTNKPDVI
jgi:glycerophosphoryl diester phosphodiesterase